ncbi:MAG: hypothetical protein CSA29_04425 [Desulfobacterales bacterium]|nr:MAG: hypothetical protein CSA29_04425 [Desulfobacterales bacterium]
MAVIQDLYKIYTISMPALNLKPYIILFLGGLIVLPLGPSLNAKTFQGMFLYYIRYEVFFLRHKIAKDTLTMVPAENDNRGENFSAYTLSCLLPGDPMESHDALGKRAKAQVLKTALEQKGLKSIKTEDLTTIVAYEALVELPMDIQITSYDAAKGGYPYTARITLSPLAFPDQWGKLQTQSTLKKLLYEFFQFFQ